MIGEDKYIDNAMEEDELMSKGGAGVLETCTQSDTKLCEQLSSFHF